MLSIWSLVLWPFLNPAWTSISSHFTYCWSLAWRILRINLLVCEMSTIVWQFEHSLELEWKLIFSSPVATAEFSKFAGILSAALSQHYLLGFEMTQLEFHLALFVMILPKAHLTLHFRMSGSRWVIIPLWLSGSWRSFLYSSSVYSCHLFLISSASVRSIHTISVLYRAHLCMKYSLGISDFFEEISSLSHSVVFLYLFVLITEEGFLISSCYSLELCIQMLISFLLSFAFRVFSFLSYL